MFCSVYRTNLTLRKTDELFSYILLTCRTPKSYSNASIDLSRNVLLHFVPAVLNNALITFLVLLIPQYLNMSPNISFPQNSVSISARVSIIKTLLFYMELTLRRKQFDKHWEFVGCSFYLRAFTATYFAIHSFFRGAWQSFNLKGNLFLRCFFFSWHLKFFRYLHRINFLVLIVPVP